VAEWGIQAAKALEHAHSLGMVHRDIKPANLLIDNQGQLWVTDFGLARTAANPGLTMTGDVVGTLRYMSPEQALAKHGLVDHRTDVYALGATLYELLTLRPAVDGKDREEILRNLALAEATRPRALNGTIPTDLDTIVLKALAKEPADRYSTALELAEDLERFTKREPIRARRPSLARRLTQWCRRHKQLVSGAVVLLFSAVLLGAVVHWLNERQRTATEEAVAEDLRDAKFWQEKEQWGKALQALELARGRLEASGLRELRDHVATRRREVATVALLEEAQLSAAQISADGNRDYDGADRAYADAFAKNGLDVAGKPPQELARQTQTSAIATQLVPALEFWAFVKDRLRDGNGASLRNIARLADRDPWRQRLRDPKVAKDLEALTALAQDVGALAQPPVNLLLLCYLLDRLPGTPRPWSAAERATSEKARIIAVQLLRKASERYPANFWINFELANHTYSDKDDTDALAYLRAALALQPQNPAVHDSLGNALSVRKRWPEAVAAYEKAIALKPDFAWAHNDLGIALKDQHKLPAAAAAFRKAIELRPDFAWAYNNLGTVLLMQGKWSDAEAACRKAIEISPFAVAYNNLGNALYYQKNFSAAADAYRKAIELFPEYANGYNNLGNVLRAQHKPPDAEAAYAKAIELKADLVDAHFNLGLVLLDQDKVPEAAQALREAIALDRNKFQYHWNLGRAYQRAGQFAESLAAMKEAHAIASRRPGADNSSAEWVSRAERFVVLDAKLPRILKGEAQPADNDERRALAHLCQLPCRQLYRAAVHFYTETFATEPEPGTNNSYNAACSAALAGCGKGKDADNLTQEEYPRLRQQALTWLRADLKLGRGLFEKEPDKYRQGVKDTMTHWQRDPDLGGVRDQAALDKLPEAERQEWRALWNEVAELGRRAGAK
jgi:serine/threonine-protein kinase